MLSLYLRNLNKVLLWFYANSQQVAVECLSLPNYEALNTFWLSTTKYVLDY